MNFRAQNAQGKYNLLMMDRNLKPIGGRLMQLRLDSFANVPGAELLLREHFQGNYSDFVEGNIYDIIQDGALQPAISPICIEDPYQFTQIGIPTVPGPNGATVLGDCSDGAVVISSDTHLTRDMNYCQLTVMPGVKLYTDNWRIFVNGDIYLYGRIQNDGADANLITGGAATPAGFYPSHGKGADGGAGGGGSGANGSGGTAGVIIQNGIALPGIAQAGNYGGRGGDRDNRTNPNNYGLGASGGTSGTYSQIPNPGAFQSFEAGYYGQIFTYNGVRQFYINQNPGSGGGGGGGALGAGASAGGNGGNGGGCGANGGIVFIACRRLIGNGVISASGGTAGRPGDGLAAPGKYGGGGGGGGWPAMSGGGAIYLATIDSSYWSGQIIANPGYYKNR